MQGIPEGQSAVRQSGAVEGLVPTVERGDLGKWIWELFGTVWCRMVSGT
jgi:hypothetical protein